MFLVEGYDIVNLLQGIAHDLVKISEQNKLILAKLETSQQLSIENLEYKINELKIDTLSGCLNLGLTAQADDISVQKIIDQFSSDCNVEVQPKSNKERT